MNSSMEKLSMCRICLTDDTPLCSIVNTNLHEIYEALTKMPFVTKDRSPIWVCDLCCASLENSYELRRRCLQSEELFTQLLRSNVQVNLQIMPDRHLSLGDVVQMIPIEWDNIKVKQDNAEESQDHLNNSNPSPAPEDVTATCSYIKVKIETDNEMPGYEEDPLRSDDHFQSSDSADISLAVLKKDQRDATAGKCTDDATVEQDEAELYHNALGLHTECDIVKEEPLCDAGAPVSKKPRLTTQMNYEDTHAYNLTRSYYTKDNIEEPKSETKRAVVDRPVKKNKIVKTRDKIDIRLRNNKQNDSTSDHNDAHKEMSENKINADRSVNSSSSNKLKQLLCDTCQKCFRRKGALIIHMRIHTGERPYKCNVCNKCFNQKSNLDMHTLTHTGEKPFKCNVCKKCFNQKVSLDLHNRTHTGEKPYQCNVCKKCFNRNNVLDGHMLIHTGEKPYKCNVCKKCFNRKYILAGHMLTHTGEKPYQCKICEKFFRSKGILVSHTLTHTGEKPFQCNVCKKCFTQRSILYSHSRIHTGEKPHECNVCKKRFNQKGSLDKHTRTHTAEKPYECNVCKKCFNHKNSLDIHMRTHTGEKHPYQCNICEKYFSMKSNLNIHMRKHSGEKPYECNICKKSFSGRSNLQRHIRLHTH